MRKKKKIPVMCDPDLCYNCTYIGNGDFICELHIEDPEKVLVVEDWAPTDNYMQCRR